MKRIIFFDEKCLLCQRAVRYILSYDQKKKFLFAPLGGETANHLLKEREKDSLVLYEESDQGKSHHYEEGKAVLRICWHLGGWHLLWGLMSFLPSFLFDWIYRYIARRRYQWFSPTNLSDKETFDHRLLP